MRRFVTPTLQISMGLLSLTISLIFIAYSFGLVPNEGNADVRSKSQDFRKYRRSACEFGGSK